MFGNDMLLRKWSKKSPTVSRGVGVPVVVEWKWGSLVLFPDQEDGQIYYVYRRGSVQGRFVVVKIDGLEPICTCQTLGGAKRCAKELNAYVNVRDAFRRGLDPVIRPDDFNAVVHERVLSWSERNGVRHEVPVE